MKQKHIDARIKQCQILAELSPCSRRKIGAMLIDPERNVVLCDGFNGTPRGALEKLCGGDTCLRDTLNIKSGTEVAIGCFHSEMNVLMNACANGIKTHGAWLIVLAEPCGMCSKHLYHAGIKKVIIVSGGYTTNEGVEFLEKYGVEVERVGGI